MATQDEVYAYYETHYDVLGSWQLRPGTKIALGDKSNRVCRFCEQRSPEVSFTKVAHAIPEALGNKSLETYYECDACNEMFGNGIENDLGNWSKPLRTFARIRGKRGVPTLKKGGDVPGWRIEYDDNGFKITSYEADPFYEIDEAKGKITFKLKRDAYTPVAVLKAFMKIGLTLLPGEEVKNFPHLMRWVRELDHSRRFAEQCPVIYSFQPGPKPNDLVTARILRRKPGITGVPYAYLVLGYGNELFQVQLPSQKQDGSSDGVAFSIYPYPISDSADQKRYGPTGRGQLDFTGRDKVRNETVTLAVGFERAEDKTADKSS